MNPQVSSISWTSNVHCHVYKNPPSVSVLSQMNPISTFPLYHCKIKLILCFLPIYIQIFQKGLILPLHEQIFLHHRSTSVKFTRPIHLILLDFNKKICVVRSTNYKAINCVIFSIISCSSLIATFFSARSDPVSRPFKVQFNPLNAELNPICHLLALLGGATIVVVSRLRVKSLFRIS